MKNRALTHPLCSLRTAWIQDLSSISSPKRFLSNWYSFSLKKKYVGVNLVLLSILVFTMIESILIVARGSQCCLPFAFSSALPSWLLSPPSLFFNFKRFYYDNVLYSRLFLTERPFFFNSPVKKISLFISLVGSKSNHLSYSICYPVGIFQISQKAYV